MTIWQAAILAIAFIVGIAVGWLGHTIWSWRLPFQEDDCMDEAGWLCHCGHYECSDFHCSNCCAEPPWGCPGDCDIHLPDEEEEWDEEEYPYLEDEE